MEGLNVAEANLTVCVHPSKSNWVSEAILRELSTVLFNFEEEILHIFGSLVPAHTGSIPWLDRNSKDVSSLDSSTKKRKDKDGQIPNHGGREAFSSDDHNYVKMSKKHKPWKINKHCCKTLMSVYFQMAQPCRKEGPHNHLYKEAGIPS